MQRQDQTSDLLQALASANAERRLEALRLLRGDAPVRTTDERPLLVTVTDAATLLGVSRSTIWRAIRHGRISKVVLYPGFERLRRADLVALVGGAL